MKYRKRDPRFKAKVVLEGLEGKIPLAELCNKYQIKQSQYYYWLNEFEKHGYRLFENTKPAKKEQKLKEENEKLKQIIAELSIELKKSELELQDLEEGGDL